MGFHRIKPQPPKDSDNCAAVLEALDKDFDGYLLLGYSKGEHEKIIVMRGDDPACRDALSFFFPTIRAWRNLASEEEAESG